MSVSVGLNSIVDIRALRFCFLQRSRSDELSGLLESARSGHSFFQICKVIVIRFIGVSRAQSHRSPELQPHTLLLAVGQCLRIEDVPLLD